MTTHQYYNVRNLVITAISLKTNERMEVSTLVTGHEAHKYINQEFNLHKTQPSKVGLYGEYKFIKVQRK
jgi:hypothetical protein